MVLNPLPNETDLKKAISMGDQKAFKLLYECYAPPLYQFILSILKCSNTSEEVLNDIFLKLWDNKEHLSSVNSLTNYIFIICRNSSINALRLLAKQNTVSLINFPEQEFINDEDEVENLRVEVLNKAIDKLPPQQQRVISMKKEGFKNEEVASEMQLSVNSVKKYQKLAIDNISKILNFSQ